jgi:hypothetical protein
MFRGGNGCFIHQMANLILADAIEMIEEVELHFVFRDQSGYEK